MTKENKELTQMGVLDIASKTHIEDLGIKSTEKLILLALCMHIYKDISDGYFCNPSHALLENETGFKSRTISQSIGILQEKGYLKSQSSKYSNTYYINAVLLMEKHNLWRQSFKDKSLPPNPFKTVSKSAMLGFEKVEIKKQEHQRNMKGFVQNKSSAQDNGIGEIDEDAPF